MLGGCAEPEFRHLRLAQRYQPGRQIQPGELAVGDRLAGQPRVGALHRRLPGDVDVVLDDRRDTAKKAISRPCRRAGRGFPGLRKALIGQAVDGRVDGLGARGGGLDYVGSADRTGSYRVGEADRVELAERIVTESVHAWHTTAPTTAPRPDPPRSERIASPSRRHRRAGS